MRFCEVETPGPSARNLVHRGTRLIKIFACGAIVIISPLEITFVFNFGRLRRLKKYVFLREREDNFAPQAIFFERKNVSVKGEIVTIFRRS